MAVERRSDIIETLEAVLTDDLSMRAGRFVPISEGLGLFAIGRPEAAASSSRGRVYVLGSPGDREEESRGGSVWRISEAVEVVISELYDHAQTRLAQKLALSTFGESVTRALCDGLGDSWEIDQTVSVRDAVTGDGYECVVPGRISYLHDMAAA